MEKKKKGLFGEGLAASFLQQSGFSIVNKNWRFKKGELDIIAKKNDLIVFAEVKTRSATAFQNRDAAVGIKQRKSILRTAHHFLEQFQQPVQHIRFDIFYLFDFGAGVKLEHFEDAFYPQLNEF